jgi:hypothetical protein
MALVLANRVQETTTTTGTGTITLAGAVAGFQSFAVIGDGNTTYYTITSGTAWEVGIGTYTASGTTLARTTILSSSAGGAAITLAGTSAVFVAYPADKSVNYDASNNVGIGTTSPGVTLDVAGDNIRLTRAANPPAFLGRQSQGTLAAPTATVSGDQITAFGGFGYTGAAYTSTPASAMRFLALETFTSTANGSGISFETTPIGSTTASRTERMRITDAGNVGIGTSAPDRKLDVQGSGSITVRSRSTDTSGITVGILAAEHASGSSLQVRAGVGFTNLISTGAADPLILSTNSTERMRITSAGNVGIGASSPAGRLALAGTGSGSTSPEISFENQTATTGRTYAIISGDGGPFRFQDVTAGAERMRIDSSGNVGIGTTSPGKTLDLVGQFRASGSAASGYALLEYGTSATATNNWHVGSEGDGTFRWYNGNFGAGTERMRIDSAGNVGIGTTSPAVRLDVVGASGGDSLIANRASNAAYIQMFGTSFPNFNTLQSLDGSGNEYWGIGGAGNANTMVFRTNSANERMRITSAGNVGIGTSSPSVKLDVNGSANFGAAIITGTGVSTGDVHFELGGNRSGSGPAYMDFHAVASTDFEARIIRYGGTNGGMDIINLGTGGMVLSQEGAAPMVFKTTATERMRIDSSGNVGIGTTGAGYRLDIASGDTTAGLGYAMRIRSNATATAATIQFTNSAVTAQNGVIACTDAGVMVLQSDGASSLLAFRTNGNERVRIDSTGSVGIGTSSPDVSALLDVSSTTKGFLPPRMSTAQRDAIGGATQEGLIIYNVTTDKLQVFSAGAWVNLH